MMLNFSPFLGLFKVFRVLWVQGRYGGGKTAFAFRLAYELLKTGQVRYVLSNCNSVWTEDIENVVLRKVQVNGKTKYFADCAIILDEAGLFMKYGQDAEKYLLGLRKLNVYLILPSVLPPSSRVRFLSVRRSLNMGRYGLPGWIYDYTLNYGDTNEKDWFYWLNPSEIFGIYDTLDYPVDDRGISDILLQWVHLVSGSADEKGIANSIESIPTPSGKSPGSGGALSVQQLDEIGRAIDGINEAAESIDGSVSAYLTERKRARRGR